jgi:magnesium-protoporphyrin O-methyltransferase
MLLELITARGASGASVLDVGGGIGVVDHQLLNDGADHAVLVEASPAYLEVAREEARRLGLTDRLEFVAGDFVRVASDLERADIVVLDRVICCYPDVERLVRRSAERARHLYGLVLPRDRWWLRLAGRLLNLSYAVRRSTYRAFVHSNALVDRLVADAGLQPTAERTTRYWRIVVFERAR